jgi:acyl-CoA synthetase (AMP-forming)/AMP-acid ligase II
MAENKMKLANFLTDTAGHIPDHPAIYHEDLIIRSGYNVYPREVEEVLYTHEAVFEAAIFGVPYDDPGEEIATVIVLKPGSKATVDELGQYIKSQVALYKYPPGDSVRKRIAQNSCR